MDEFIRPRHTILDRSTPQESVLVTVDNLKYHFLQPIGEELSQQL